MMIKYERTNELRTISPVFFAIYLFEEFFYELFSFLVGFGFVGFACDNKKTWV